MNKTEWRRGRKKEEVKKHQIASRSIFDLSSKKRKKPISHPFPLPATDNEFDCCISIWINSFQKIHRVNSYIILHGLV